MPGKEENLDFSLPTDSNESSNSDVSMILSETEGTEYDFSSFQVTPFL